jgi:molecular chaperone GrpE (heat shock protein)
MAKKVNGKDESTKLPPTVASLQAIIGELEATIQHLHESLAQQEKKLNDQELITKRAQADYVSLKLDMDAYMHRVEEHKQSVHLDSMMSVFKKLLPHITNFQHMISTTPSDLIENTWTQWVHIVAKKLFHDIETLWVTVIETELWTEPDMHLHQPLWSQPVEDPALNGKIVAIVEPWYHLSAPWKTLVLYPAKVMIWLCA